MLDTALALFAEQGYRATTTAQIEKALGLRPGGGGLYRHVRSKEELLQLAVDRARDRRRTPPPGPFRTPQEAFVSAVLTLTDADLDLWKLVVREPGLPIDKAAFYAEVIQPAFEQAIEWLETSTDIPDARGRATVAISALLYLRISEFTYGTTPGGLHQSDFLNAVQTLLGGEV